jgi:hypothetical protein
LIPIQGYLLEIAFSQLCESFRDAGGIPATFETNILYSTAFRNRKR